MIKNQESLWSLFTSKIIFSKRMKTFISDPRLALVLLFPFLPTPTLSQLSAVYSHVKLPTHGYFHRTWYDGQESIYLFGGGDGILTDATGILRYSLSNDTIHSIGSLRLNARFGSVHSDWDGNVFYFGGGSNGDRIIKYSPLTNSSSVIAQYPVWSNPTPKLDNNTVLILGKRGDELEIVSFDLARGTSSQLDVQLPVSLSYGGAIKLGKDKAYLFPIQKELNQGIIWEMDLATMSFKNMGLPFPVISDFSSFLTDGRFIYIFARFKSNLFTDTKGIFKVEPVAMTTSFLHVDNWPLANRSRIFVAQPASIYIPEMNRIHLADAPFMKMSRIRMYIVIGTMRFSFIISILTHCHRFQNPVRWKIRFRYC